MKGETIFLRALECDETADRAEYLEAACAGDAELRLQVEELLQSHEEAGEFLEGSLLCPSSTIDSSNAGQVIGSHIGPYTLIERIGEGGMGTVYLAEQREPVRRRVALKFIKPGMDSAQVVARFEAERQALAHMDHPNIAKVFDAGTTATGRPYFVMELVSGAPITEHCDREHLSIPDRLELFLLICRAVQHAHQKAVIHRDLKPSNILVTVIDGVAVPKVIDFGVAKAISEPLDDWMLTTGIREFVGTPLYMSPEQADGSNRDVDTRSDIYSLGVLLYELLTGTTPFDSVKIKQATFDEMRRIIREDEAPKPSTRLESLGGALLTVSERRQADPRQLARSLRGELDWVVMKALEKDRARRYESANGLAAELMRYLAEKPVEARPPSARYRTQKFVRRNRSIVIPSAVLTFLTVAGLLVGLLVVTRERDEAHLQRRRADARFQLAFQAVNQLRYVSANLQSIAGPEATARLRNVIKNDLIRYHSQLVENNEGDPAIGFELGDSYFYLSTIYGTTNPASRDRAFHKALEAYERSARERPDDTRVLNGLAFQYSRLAKRYLEHEPARAETARKRALEIYEHVAKSHPDRTDDWVNIYYVANAYGAMLRGQGRLAEAEALDRRTLGWFERPEVDRNWFDTGEETHGYGFMFLSNLLVANGRAIEAIPILKRAWPHLVFDNDYDQYFNALNRLLMRLAVDPDIAVRARAVSLAREGVERTSRTDALSWLRLGLVLERTGVVPGSDEAFRRGIELGGQQADNALNGFAWMLVSETSFGTVRPAWAVQMAERAVQLAPNGAGAWNTLGVAHYRAGDWNAAVAALEKAEQLTPGKSLAFNAFFLAMSHWQVGDRTQARDWYDKAVAWMESTQPGNLELRRFRSEADQLLNPKTGDTVPK